MRSIDSIRHPLFLKLRECRTLKGQRELCSFLVEEELIQEAIDAGYMPEAIVVTDQQDVPGVPTYRISQGMMRKIFPQGRPPTAVALCQSKLLELSQFQKKQFVVILEGIQDCGNLGTMLRTCEAFGVDGVIIIEADITHLYNRVTVRSSRGSLFRLDLCQAEASSLASFFKENDFELIATSPHASEMLGAASFNHRPLAVAFGNETSGLSEEMEKLADRLIAIKMQGKIESLNVAVSCGIILQNCVS